MNTLQRLEHWGDSHHPKWLDIIRIALGIFLCIKGIEFAQHKSMMMDLMSANVPFSSLMLILLGHYVLFAHIMGGFFLALGMLTRFVCLIQIPILLGAIIFINSTGLFDQFSELALSIMVLLLLIYFAIIGGGRWSFDWYLDRQEVKKRAY